MVPKGFRPSEEILYLLVKMCKNRHSGCIGENKRGTILPVTSQCTIKVILNWSKCRYNPIFIDKSTEIEIQITHFSWAGLFFPSLSCLVYIVLWKHEAIW